MAYNHTPAASIPLPGPVTEPSSNLPSTSPPISLQHLSPSSTLTITSQDKRNSAWKYEGYKAFSSWMASEDDFFLFRRFGDLNCRTILWMQDRIKRVEDDLRRLDEWVEKSHPDEKLRNDSFKWDEQHMQQRHAHMEQLSRQLHHYNQFIDSYAKVRARPRADERLIQNVKSWLARGAVAPEESSFIDHTSDLTSIHHRTQPPLGRWLESFGRLHRSRLFRAKRGNDADEKASGTTISSNSRFDFITNTSIILGGLVMLLAPLWWLEYVNDSEKKLAVMTGFICVFVGLMSTATVNRPGEVVAATAAYTAVLMVFMQVDGKGDKP
ncbi:hypothetical protein P171DRAFT_522900 [Karstenula rhodostoma CBS 690.94]|uniref:DUF6594 domain-containing protein n=1 Tax=Karstenula rhodostoma CBS 690.94 TaxID=1392251 RepID=A0A9P4PDR1_9PLEO|nr:hypothetical protein P171DRAFT_522900 [Karstenula rhodostoma CBS 690.94]